MGIGESNQRCVRNESLVVPVPVFVYATLVSVCQPGFVRLHPGPDQLMVFLQGR